MEVTRWLKPSVSVPRIVGSCECAGRNESECRASLEKDDVQADAVTAMVEYDPGFARFDGLERGAECGQVATLAHRHVVRCDRHVDAISQARVSGSTASQAEML